MAKNILHIHTDKTQYSPGDNVTVTATMDGWVKGAKVKLAIYNKIDGTVLNQQMYDKPTNGNTVNWVTLYSTFVNSGAGAGTPFQAQIAFGNFHVESSLFSYIH